MEMKGSQCAWSLEYEESCQFRLRDQNQIICHPADFIRSEVWKESSKFEGKSPI